MTMQLSLFDEQDAPRPLPLLIAAGGKDWQAFPLQYNVVEDVHYYAVQDWLRGVAKTDNAARFWTDLQTRAEKTHKIQLYASCVQLPYTASNGKTYQMDYANAETLYQITQYMDSTTGIRAHILKYLAKAGVKLDEMRVTSTTPLLTERARGVPVRNSLMAAAKETHINNRPLYGVLTDTQYKALFGMVAKQLESELGGKVRDQLGDLALAAIRNAEDSATYGLRIQGDALTDGEQINICLQCAMIAARALDEYCALMKVDRLRNQPMLSGGVR